MAIEIERKFLLADNTWRTMVNRSVEFRQGYLSQAALQNQDQPPPAVRVRVAAGSGFLTIKSAIAGIRRVEFEYPIAVEDATTMLDDLCRKPLIEKVRHYVDYQGHVWEIDEFHGENQGLIVAEVELLSEQEHFAKPAWLGREVSAEARYYNASLAQHPFQAW